MKALILLFLLWGQMAGAQTIQVTSGDHEGFSRLVLVMPNSVAWHMNRNATGYVLHMAGKDIRFDLTDAYRRITRARLATIHADPADGSLQLGIGCDCHAIPFELRRGVLVIDIRDGPAPPGSSFELTETGMALPAFPLRPVTRPAPRPQSAGAPAPLKLDPEWRDAASTAASLTTTPDLNPLPISPQDPAITEMRNALLWQLSKGAAEGVVDFAEPPRQPTAPPHMPQPLTQLRIGEQAGFDPAAADREADRMTGTGEACIPDDRLRISDWGNDHPVAMEIGTIRSGLVGEFDRPAPDVVTAASRYYLYLGFGLEARQLLQGLDIAAPDRALWEAMAHILDGEDVPGQVLAGMEVCDTAAALWAALAAPEIAAGPEVNTAAIQRSFSALPLHLRRHLGPGLAERFLARQDRETARAIKDAILRAPGNAGASVKLMEARIELANGRSELAEQHLTALTTETGPVGVEAIMTLINEQARVGKTIDPVLITALESYLLEAKGGPKERMMRDALALGYATQDRFDDAFSQLPITDDAAVPVWRRLAENGSDSAIIRHAIFGDGTTLPSLSAETDRLIAGRLIGLGFADPALLWITPDRRKDGAVTIEDRLLAAEAHLLQRDARATLRDLSGIDAAPAENLRALALLQLEDPQAATSFALAGFEEEASQAARRMAEWTTLSALSPEDLWGKAALLAMNSSGSEPAAYTDGQPAAGPLAQGEAAVAESAAAREILEMLIADQQLPDLIN